jgi:hypothetical protein
VRVKDTLILRRYKVSGMRNIRGHRPGPSGFRIMVGGPLMGARDPRAVDAGLRKETS